MRSLDMADKNLQFLDIPARAIRRSCRSRCACTEFREIYAQFDADGAAQQAGRCLVLRQSVLRVEVPGAQLHSELAEADPGRQPVRGGGAVAQDELAAGDVRAHLPAGSAVRRRVHAQRRPGRGDDRLDREVHHRRGVQAGLDAGHVERACRPASASRSSAPGPRASAARTFSCATA